MNENGFFSYFKNSPKKWLMIGLGVVGALLLILGSRTAPKTSESESADVDMTEYARSLESRIVELCEQVKGVSDVSVLLTLDGGTERVYAEDGDGGGSRYVIVSVGGEERTVLVREIYASVRGIAVVCRGGGDTATKRTLTELLSCALGVPVSKISVAGAGK